MNRTNATFWCKSILAVVTVLCAGAVLAEKMPETVNNKWVQDLRDGKIKIEGDHAAVQSLILGRNIPIPYDYIATLMRTPNAFGQGPACIVCHASTDPKKSYRGLNLSTCRGIKNGSTEAPVNPIFRPGEKASKSILGRRLRNNRMPLGVPFTASANPDSVKLVRDWIAEGAKNTEHFKNNVLPMFAKDNAFASHTPACTACHMSNQEPPSFHELDLSSYEGIMLGADSVAKGVANSTKVVIPGKPNESSILQHLIEDRMPPGIAPTEDRDHPNTLILLRWIEQGARCD